MKVKKESAIGEEWIIQLKRGENSQGEGDTISSSDTEGDSHCRRTGSRFQYGPERNREHHIITVQETQLLLSTAPERVEQKTKSELRQP